MVHSPHTLNNGMWTCADITFTCFNRHIFPTKKSSPPKGKFSLYRIFLPFLYPEKTSGELIKKCKKYFEITKHLLNDGRELIKQR